MAKYELKIPKLGESVIEATVTNWLKKVGDSILMDEGVLEVATDKVDTEISSDVPGILLEILVEKNQVAKIGQTIAIIETDVVLEKKEDEFIPQAQQKNILEEDISNTIQQELQTPYIPENKSDEHISNDNFDENRYYSPLVRSIAEKENISRSELASIIGTGLNERVTKEDIFNYLDRKEIKNTSANDSIKTENESFSKPKIINSLRDEIIPLDRMGKIIAEHMTYSIHTSAHVQSFIDIDVTNIALWRSENKDLLFEKTGEKLTFTPIFMLAVAQTIGEFPMVNISLEGENIIKKKNINLGMATALPDGNLIVPVIKNAIELNLLGMVRAVNTLSEKARKNKLSPDDIQGGTYTVTNVGTFGSIIGTPIINQPQVAILALGAIKKTPAVIEHPEGDYIAIRQIMMVAHSYDHRVINGALGGQFILRLKEKLEHFEHYLVY